MVCAIGFVRMKGVKGRQYHLFFSVEQPVVLALWILVILVEADASAWLASALATSTPFEINKRS